MPPPVPSIAPRTPTVGDPALLANLSSFAGTTQPRFVVLGPSGWQCGMTMFDNTRAGVVVFDPTTGASGRELGAAPIAVVNDDLRQGGVGAGTACSVFDDPAVVQYVTRSYPRYLPCPRAGRTVTRIDAHVSTFVDADGARGAGWINLPASAARDGLVSVLTCRPTAGLTAADCDTIIADFVARNDSAG